MQEGDIVMVVGNLDNRVRNNTETAIRVGTVVSITKDDVQVLLPNGDLWKGPKREVVLQSEQESSDS